MAYTFDVIAWEEWPRPGQTRGDRHAVTSDRQLPPARNVHGVKVLATNPDDDRDVHQFWMFTLKPFDKWGQWYVYIGAIMVSNHNYELADEIVPPDGGAEA